MTQESGDGASGGSASVEPGGDGTFDALAAAVGEGVYRLDADGRFSAVNDVLVDLLGYEREALIGEPLPSFVAEEDVEAVESTIRALQDGGDGRARDGDRDREDDRGGRAVGEVEASLRTASGELAPCSLRIAAVDSDGRFAGTAGSLRVVADRRREVEALEPERDAVESEFDEALDRVSDAFFAVDEAGRFTYVNEQAGELLDRDPEALVGEDVVEELHGGENTPFVENALEAVETGEPVTFEEFYPPLSRWFRVRVYPAETGATVYFHDVTEEHRRESILEQYETVVETVDDGLYAVDEEYRFTLVNDAYCELTGYDREELIGAHISKVLDEETTEVAQGLRDDLLASDEESGSVEVEIVRADGERVTVDSSYAAMPGDEFHGTVGVVRDVTDRKAFEEMLEALHVASRELHDAETSDDVADVVLGTLTDVLGLPTATLFRKDEDAGVLVPEHQTSAAAGTGQELPELPAGEGSLTGHVLETGEFHACDDIRETSFVDEPKTEIRAGLIAPLDEDRVLVVSSSEPGAFDERTERLVEILAGNASATIERQERERELRESERRYRTLVDNFPGGAVALYDEECHYVAVGGQMYDQIDLSPEDAVGKTIGERLSGEIAEALESLIGRAFEGETAEAEATYDGRDFWLQSLPIRDDDGDVILAMVVTQDVTERKRAEEALEDSERRFRTMMEQSPLSTQIFDPDGNALMVNPAWEELWGASSDDLGDYNVLEDEQLAEKGILSHLEKAFEGEATQLPTVHYDPEEIGKVGRPRWIEAFAYPVFDESGDIREVVLIHNDVTERRERERELERYERIVETVDDGVYVLDDEGRFVQVNEAFAELTGHDREELIGADVTKVTTGEYRDVIEEEVRQLEKGEVSVGTVETEVLTAGGERVPVEARFSLFPLAEGTYGRVGTIRDVSDRIERERALAQSEQRYRTLVDNFPNGSVGLFDSDLRYLIVGGQIYDEIGLSVEDVIGMPIEERLPSDLWDPLEEPIRATFDGEHHQTEVEAEGRIFQVQTLPVRDDGDVIAGMIMSQDVTERKEYERELERYEHIVETVRDGVYVVDDENRYVLVNDAYCDIVGYEREELIGRSSATVIGEEAVAELEAMAAAAAESGGVDVVEIDIERPDGETVTLETRFAPYPTEDGVGRMGVIRDATERKERERELERYETAFDTASDVVVTIDDESTIRDVNPAVADVFGYEPDELVGEPLPTLMPERFRRQHHDGLDRYLETGESRLDWEYIELPGRHRDGHEIPLAISFGEFEYDGDRYFTGIIRDNTERKRAERQLEEERDMFAEGPTVVMRWEIGEGWPVGYVSDNVEQVLGYTPEELESGDVRYKDLLLDEEVDRISREVMEASDEATERFSHDPYRIKTKGGDVRWVKDVTKILRDESGDITGYLGYLVDVTERKERERELAEERERYQGLVESAPIAIGTYDADGRVTFANDAAAEILGADDPDVLVGEATIEFVHPDEQDETTERMQRVIEEREMAEPRETKLVGLDGEVRWAMVASAPITREGEPAAQVVMSDVTERKEYERRLEESEQRYRTLIENFPNGAVALVDQSMRYRTVGGSPLEVAGTTREELEGAPLEETLPPELADELVPRYEAALRGESAEFEAEFDGRIYQFHVLPVRDDDGEVFAAMGMSQEVTERKEYERQLEESEQRYRSLVEHFPNGAVGLYDHDLRLTAIGGDIYENVDASIEGVEGMLIEERVGPDLFERLEPSLRSALEGEADQTEIHVDGLDFWVHTLPIRSDDGEVLSGIVMVQDFTDRKEHERTLERFQTIIETVDDGVYTIDSEGYITMANAAYAEMVGYHREELIGMHASELVDEAVHEQARDIEAELAEESTTIARLTADLKTADGSSVTAEATFALLPGDDEDYERVAVVRDITERVEREAELERALDLLDRAGKIAEVAGWEIDAEAGDVYWSDQLYDLLGLPRGQEPPLEEALDVYHEDDRPIVEGAIQEALESAEPFDVEIRFEREDGDLRWARLWGVPDVDDGEVVSLRGAFQDVTERVERERELERFEVLFEESTDVNAVLDTEGNYQYLTPSVTNVLGYEREELIGENAFDYIHPEDREVAMEEFATLLEDPEHRPAVEIRFRHADGSWVHLDARANNLLEEPAIGGVVAYTRDISEIKERERELRERIEQEDVVTQLGTLALEEPDLDRLFERATAAVAGTLDNDLCKLLEFQPDGESLLLRAGEGWDDGLVGSATLGTGDDSIAGRTLETEEAIVVDDIQAEDPADRPDLLTAHGGRSGVSVIVGTPSDPWGVLGTYDTDVKEFSQQDVNFVQSVANILGIAIERAAREEELHRRIEQQQVVTDLGKQALEDIDVDRLFEEAVERVAETLDNEYAKVLELQPDGESLLLRSGVGWRDGLVGEGTVGTGDDSQAGHTIRSEEPIVVTDLATEERFSGPELLTSHGVESGISTIIGPFEEPWGVLGTHNTDVKEFSQQDVNFVQSVANILATAIDRRTREREIEHQRNRMAAIVRLSEIVQEVDQAVIEQSTREEIDRLVCDHLVDSGEYAAAWVGDVNLASQTVAPRAVAGLPDDQIESVSFDADDEGDQGSPTAAAAATGEAWTARADEDEDAFPEVVAERGFRSMAAVPLAFEDVRYGVLTLFSDRASAFEGYERAVLEQLGRTVGHAINAIDRKQALVGDSFTELEIRLPGVLEALDFGDEGEHTIAVEGTVPASGDRMIQYLTVTGLDSETFLAVVDELPAVGEVREIGGDGPSYRYEVTYEDPPITGTLASYGGRIESISFDVPDLCITAAMPPSADVRQIVGTLRSEFPTLRIDAQRTVTREHESAEEHRNAIEDALTERQRTALMTAFFAGYFEWSRESTGEEVAETLGVSPSTFHQHLRAAQRKVLSRLFEGERSG